jgi:hypothetical protein
MFNIMGIEVSKLGIEFLLMSAVYYFYFRFTSTGSLIAGAEQAASQLIVDISFKKSLNSSLLSLRCCGLNLVDAAIFAGIRLFFHSPRMEITYFIRPFVASLIVSFASMAINRGLHSSAIIGAEAAADWKRRQEISESGIYAAEVPASISRDAAQRQERGLWD